jgi:signal peptidase
MSRTRLAKLLRYTTLAVGVLLWFMFLRPQWLGGPAAYMIVRGNSMLPTYTDGDLVLVLSQPSYAVGDAIAYRIPDGEVGAGLVVIHRIVDESAPESFVIRGDNNPAPDPWAPSTADVLGRVQFAVPGLGRVLEVLLDPTIAASLAATIVVVIGVAQSVRPRAGVARQSQPAT